MEFGSTLNGLVAEEGVHLNVEGLLLQDKVRDGKGELERSEPMVITPLAVEGGDGQRVSPRWVVKRIKRFYPIIGLSVRGVCFFRAFLVDLGKEERKSNG
jgi:hypothetical protein